MNIWSPYQEGKYLVTFGEGGAEHSDSPEDAITRWYRAEKLHPLDAAIMCETRAQAVELCEAATPELLTALDAEYGCPYKLSYMVGEVEKKVADGQKYFHEHEGFGDTVHPFGFG